MMFLYTSSHFSLLDGSQTLLGVLATIVILCVILNANNPIHSILSSVREKISTTITDIAKEVVDQIRDDVRYLLLRIREKGDEPEDGEVKKGLPIILINEIQPIENRCNTEFDKIKGKYLNHCEYISETEEQTSAPIYTFLFCLIVFICEELLYYPNIIGKDQLMTFLLSFVLLSCVLWTSLWGFFIGRTRLKTDREKKTSPIVPMNWTRWLYKAGTCIGLFLVLYVLFIWAYSHFNISLLIDAFPIIAIGLIIISSVPFWGLRGLRRFNIKHNNYSKTFIFSHFSNITLLSIIYAFIVYFLSSMMKEIPLFINSPTWAEDIRGTLKFIIIMFVIINGLVLPFCMVLFRYNHCIRIAYKDVSYHKNNFQREIDEYKKKL